MPQIYLPGLKSLAAERKQASLYSGDYLWLAHLLKAESWQWKWKWMWKWEWEWRWQVDLLGGWGNANANATLQRERLSSPADENIPTVISPGGHIQIK